MANRPRNVILSDPPPFSPVRLLPESVWNKIFSYLSTFRHFYTCIRVCRTWKRAAMHWHHLDCRDVHVTDTRLRLLARRALHLHVITLDSCLLLTDTGLTDFLRISKSLHRLSLQHCGTLEDSWQAIARYGASLTALDLTGWGQRINDEAVTLIAQRCRGLQCVCLAETQVSDRGGEAVARQLGRSLECLNLSHCRNVADRTCAALAKHCPGLRELRCCWSSIPSHGCSLLAQSCTRLEVLEFRFCVCLTDAVAALIEACGPSLRRVSLGGCTALGDETAEALGLHAPGVTHLDLYACEGVTDRGLLTLLRGCPRIEVLRLPMAQLTDHALRYLPTWARRLHHLDLSAPGPGVTPKGIAGLKAALRGTQVLC